ncbi:MAG: pentapeptide repeat-containing protein [Ruegeria sp.]
MRVISGDEAYKLWKSGAESWNRWARRESRGTRVEFKGTIPRDGEGGSADFRGYYFPVSVTFNNVTLVNAAFDDASFGDHVSFLGTVFKNGAMFEKTHFVSGAAFRSSRFEGTARFLETTFSKRCDFQLTRFQSGAVFRGANFEETVTFNNLKCKKFITFSDVHFHGAADFRSSTFNGSCNFMSSTFEKGASFPNAKFQSNANFAGTSFQGISAFGQCHFKGPCSFELSTFDEVASFFEAKFEGRATFRHSKFNGSLDISGAKFLAIPDFRQTALGHHLSLRSAKISCGECFEDGDADRLRRLKEIAIQTKDHVLEQEFFALEMTAARTTEVPEQLQTRPLYRIRPSVRQVFKTKQFGNIKKQMRYEVLRRQTSNELRLLPNYLYGLLSDFGQSITRPILGILASLFIFATLFRAIATCQGAGWTSAFVYSGSLLFPFFSFARNEGKLARDALFGEDFLSLPLSVFGLVEGTLGLIFVFLIGLALRNRFRL